MTDATLLVGVSHSRLYLDDVIRFLDSEGINHKRVMLELAKNRVPSEPNGLDFFRKIGNYVAENGGILIYGDDEEILERAYAKDLELFRKMSAPKISIMKWAELDRESRYKIPHFERDPHFLKVASEQNPEIIVLGRRHILFLVEKHYSILPNRVVYIPTKE